jgi:folate-dependent tRNA-U54 methylase TrmFO/GidA
MTALKSVTIIGGGLAGSEAAFFLLKKGYAVELLSGGRRSMTEPM